MGPPPDNTVRNERLKLAATFLNTVAAGCVVVGIIAPLASLFLGLAPAAGPSFGRAAALVGVLLAFSAALHWVARTILGRLRP